MKTYKRFLPYVHWLFLLILLGGCATVGSMRPWRPVFFEDGFHFQQPYGKVFDAAQEVLKDLGLNLKEVEPTKNYIIATHGISFWSFGEVVGVYFVPGDTETRVLVISRPKFTGIEGFGSYHGPVWTDDVYRGLSLKLR